MPVEGPQYPVSLVLAGRPCLVVGGGSVAARKVAGLRACGARVHVVATDVGASIREMKDVTWEERPYRSGEVAGYRLAMAATDDPLVNRMVFEEGEAAGVWVNSADDTASSSFTLPSVARQGPVVVAVSTGGRSPALAAWIRDCAAGQLGPEHEVLADLLADERARLQEAGRSTEGLDWRKALGSDMLDLLRAGRVEQARERLRACL